MVSLRKNSHSNSNPFSLSRSFYSQSPSSTTKIRRQVGRSMRRIRSNLYQIDNSCSFTSSAPENSGFENLTESDIDIRLGELAAKSKAKSVKFESDHEDYLEISQAFTDFSACSSDISGDLERLAGLPTPDRIAPPEPEPRQNFSTECLLRLSRSASADCNLLRLR